MPYTDSSGVQIPVGTDSFSPTSQFKTWQDKNATYNYRMTVNLDTDRTALAAPVRRNGLEVYVESTKTMWLYDGGWFRTGGVKQLQLDTTNSGAFLVTQWGIGKVTGSAAAVATKAITFPLPFASTPIPFAHCMGVRAPVTAFNPAGLSGAGSVLGTLQAPSNTGGTITMYQTTGGATGATTDLYYSWSVTGVLA